MMYEADEEYLRSRQVGLLWVLTKGVVQGAYKQLYPKPSFYQADHDSLEARMMRLFRVPPLIFEGKVDATEMQTRMAKSFLLSQHPNFERGYETSYDILTDFANACGLIDETIFLKSDKDGNVHEGAFGCVYIKTEEQNTVATVSYISKQGNRYRIRPEYEKGNTWPRIYFYFPVPEDFYTQIALKHEEYERKSQEIADTLAALCTKDNWIVKQMTAVKSEAETQIEETVLYEVETRELGDCVHMSFSRKNSGGYISIVGEIENMRKAVELLCDLFDKHKGELENIFKIGTKQ